jgi:hypothetical protein
MQGGRGEQRQVHAEITSRRPAAEISTFTQKNAHAGRHAAATVMARMSSFAAAAILHMVVKTHRLLRHT